MGGVQISPGDIVMGDLDGVIVIPQACEESLFASLEGFLEANGKWGKIAARALAAGTPLTEEPALAAMFDRKYSRPESYWREYAPWWQSQRGKYEALIAANASLATPGFYCDPAEAPAGEDEPVTLRRKGGGRAASSPTGRTKRATFGD